jgi:cytochrome c biogenesis protein ResB
MNWLRVLQISLTYCSIEGKLIQEMQSTRYKRGYCTMSALAKNTATTPIPVQLSATVCPTFL